MVRVLALAGFALALAGCGATAEGEGPGGAPAAQASAVERCTDRLLGDLELEELSKEEAEATRRSTESTYCAPFAERGWVYEDGTLSIDAHTWLGRAGEEVCAEAGEGQEGPGTTVSCDEADEGEGGTIDDCALLRHVRASEVREYLDGLERRHGGVACEDGTRLADLGAE